jgi:hypothetical protein
MSGESKSIKVNATMPSKTTTHIIGEFDPLFSHGDSP